MTSIMTNQSAMTALQSLTNTNKNLSQTQNRISTGYRVSNAEDNAAYWSIATTMRPWRHIRNLALLFTTLNRLLSVRFHRTSKHIEIRYHKWREWVQKKDSCTCACKNSRNGNWHVYQGSELRYTKARIGNTQHCGSNLRNFKLREDVEICNLKFNGFRSF